MQEKFKNYIIHPFMIATFPILFLFVENIDELSLSELYLPIIISLLLTVALWFIVGIFIKDKIKRGLLLSLFIGLFFAFGHFYIILWSLAIHGFVIRYRYLIIIWFVFWATLSYLIIIARRQFINLNIILNIITVFLVVGSLSTIIFYKVRNNFETSHIVNPGSFEGVGDNLAEKPDIYYIILDSYARSDTLKNIYNYDNSEFIDFLTSKGFVLPAISRSNYTQSALSLSSSLNMEYINYMSQELGENSDDTNVLNRMIENSRVMKFLKSKGYKYIRITSDLVPNKNDRYADLNLSGGRFNDFSMLLLRSTVLKPFIENILMPKDIRESVLFCFDKLSEMPKISEPKFVSVHIISPHPPYVFGPNGEARSSIEMIGEGGGGSKEEYVDQVNYISKKTKEVVNTILSESKTPPIIILQADHGPSHTGTVGWNNPTPELVQERMRILEAYYLPYGGQSQVYERMSPVNTFRIIFNYYFKTDFEKLPDINYFSTYDKPYKFTDVTDKFK